MDFILEDLIDLESLSNLFLNETIDDLPIVDIEGYYEKQADQQTLIYSDKIKKMVSKKGIHLLMKKVNIPISNEISEIVYRILDNEIHTFIHDLIHFTLRSNKRIIERKDVIRFIKYRGERMITKE